LEEEVADEEEAGAQPVHGFAELQVGEHVQLGEADVDAVEVGDDVAQHQERQQSPRHLAVQRVFLRDGRNVGRGRRRNGRAGLVGCHGGSPRVCCGAGLHANWYDQYDIYIEAQRYRRPAYADIGVYPPSWRIDTSWSYRNTGTTR